MEKLTKGANQARIHYDALTNGATTKILALENVLPFNRFIPAGKDRYIEEYYDTEDHLLTSSGLILSKVQTNKTAYFKLDSPSLIQSSKNEQTYYVQPCSKNAKPIDQAISIVDSITEVYGTQFKIDLMRILKIAKVNMVVDMQRRRFDLVSGTGFKAKIDIEEIIYQNYETKRKVKREGVTVSLVGGMEHLQEFISFTDAIDKHIKELVPQKMLRFFILTKLTEPLVKKDEKKKP